MEKNKKKIIIGIACAICAIIVIIAIIMVMKKEPTIKEDSNNAIKTEDNKEPIKDELNKDEPNKDNNKKEEEKDEKKDENKNNDGTNSSVKDPIEGEITQEKAIRLIKKIVVPSISNNSSGIKVNIIGREKVNEEECYIATIELVKEENKTQKCGTYAVSLSGKYIYSQDSKTKEYKKFVQSK